jgi:hypothetical protein
MVLLVLLLVQYILYVTCTTVEDLRDRVHCHTQEEVVEVLWRF